MKKTVKLKFNRYGDEWVNIRGLSVICDQYLNEIVDLKGATTLWLTVQTEKPSHNDYVEFAPHTWLENEVDGVLIGRRHIGTYLRLDYLLQPFADAGHKRLYGFVEIPA